MGREHYIVEVTRKGRPLFLLWFTGDQDGLLTDEAGGLRVFASDEQAKAFAAAHALGLGTSEPSCFDLDAVDGWAATPEKAQLESAAILDVWNLLTDVARSVGDEAATARLLDRAMLPAYDRLVSNCDLPALGRLPGVGELDDEDRRAVADVLRDGLACFDRAVTDQST